MDDGGQQIAAHVFNFCARIAEGVSDFAVAVDISLLAFVVNKQKIRTGIGNSLHKTLALLQRCFCLFVLGNVAADTVEQFFLAETGTSPGYPLVRTVSTAPAVFKPNGIIPRSNTFKIGRASC